MNREKWLETMTDHLRPDFVAVGRPIPDRVRVSCGYTSKGMRSKRIGECWASVASADETPEVFIVPGIADSLRVGDILVHELIHATGIMGHKGDFRRVAVALGLEGKMTATVAGERLRARLAEIVAEIGDYPHAILSGNSAKKQSTRMLKMECDYCGFIARTTAKWLGEVGPPACACSGETMRVCD